MKEEAYETLQMALLACAFIYFIGLGARFVSKCLERRKLRIHDFH